MLIGTTIPILLAILGIVFGMAAARDVRRGGARFYALERDLMLRRANFWLVLSVVLFSASVGLLVFDTQQQEAAEEAARATATAEFAAATASAPLVAATATPDFAESLPPVVAPPPTEDPNAPTPTPTPIIRRAIVENTGGSGVYLRERAGTDALDVMVLRDGDILTLIDQEQPVEANGYRWVKVRTIAGQEGWVAELFLAVQNR